MPTDNPRISVTLTPSTAAVLRRLSALSGDSQSSHVASLLEATLPVLERVIAVMQAAKEVQEESLREIADGLGKAQRKAEAQLELTSADFDAATLPLVKAAESIRRRKARSDDERAERAGFAPSASRAAFDPLPLTGGSGTPKRSTQAAKRGKSRGSF